MKKIVTLFACISIIAFTPYTWAQYSSKVKKKEGKNWTKYSKWVRDVYYECTEYLNEDTKTETYHCSKTIDIRGSGVYKMFNDRTSAEMFKEFKEEYGVQDKRHWLFKMLFARPDEDTEEYSEL